MKVWMRIKTKAIKKIPQIEWIECLIKSLITINHSLHGLHLKFYLIFETQLIHSLSPVRRTVAARLQQLLEPQDTMRFLILSILSAMALVQCMGNIS